VSSLVPCLIDRVPDIRRDAASILTVAFESDRERTLNIAEKVLNKFKDAPARAARQLLHTAMDRATSRRPESEQKSTTRTKVARIRRLPIRKKNEVRQTGRKNNNNNNNNAGDDDDFTSGGGNKAQLKAFVHACKVCTTEMSHVNSEIRQRRDAVRKALLKNHQSDAATSTMLAREAEKASPALKDRLRNSARDLKEYLQKCESMAHSFEFKTAKRALRDASRMLGVGKKIKGEELPHVSRFIPSRDAHDKVLRGSGTPIRARVKTPRGYDPARTSIPRSSEAKKIVRKRRNLRRESTGSRERPSLGGRSKIPTPEVGSRHRRMR